jgi:hypothetical protein
MPYSIRWYIEGEVIYIQNRLETSTQELHDLLMDINAYIAQSERPLVHVINDLSQVTKPFSLVEIAQALKGIRPDPRMGWVIMVGEKDKLVKFISSIARQLLHVRQRSYETLEEALDFLRDIDSGLDWSKADAGGVAFVPRDGLES